MNRLTFGMLVTGESDNIELKCMSIIPGKPRSIVVDDTISSIGIEHVFEQARRESAVLILENLGEFPTASLDLIADELMKGGIRAYAWMLDCPCGRSGEECSCTENQIYKYRNRIPDRFLNLFKGSGVVREFNTRPRT